MLGSVVVFSVLLYPAKPDTSIVTWAQKKAKKELREEGIDI